ncbi:hypothetical protein [Pajaroellobacter abortibovis]|uniref:Uncharacterized protein n=1 Tax=Pajaroellobacter abortibovis TaxID=1882918 RepID=A0A1L6MY46_9BACT|nr:hypothetical protein [Pajaroellobacter abortibovis]APS00474.1 hypothetical protein BCY86_07140 [Pajaroellobacter abortibovis]
MLYGVALEPLLLDPLRCLAVVCVERLLLRATAYHHQERGLQYAMQAVGRTEESSLDVLLLYVKALYCSATASVAKGTFSSMVTTAFVKELTAQGKAESGGKSQRQGDGREK